jgi:tetraacyldisaccharide 4'-kinase
MNRVLSVESVSPLGWALAPLVPIASLYGLAMRARSALYACGLLTQYYLPCRVISVGNLTVGGTGKTPVVIALATALRDRGCRVGVVSRGYKRRSAETLLEVSDGRAVRGDPREAGDEPFLIAQRCLGVAVAVGADRPSAGKHLITRYRIDTLIMDDGYQHLALRRDTNILVLDAGAPFGNGYLLPRGRLREPLAAMARASAVLVTRASQGGRLDELKAAVRAITPTVPIWITDFVPSAVVQVGGATTVEPSVLKGERVLAVSGIGQPDSFRRLLEAAGAAVAEHCVFPDHHAYSREDVQKVRQAAEQLGVDRIVTTEKDAVKLAQLVSSPSPLEAGGHGEGTPTIPSPLEGEGRVRGEVWAVRIDLQWLEGREEWTRVVLNG